MFLGTIPFLKFTKNLGYIKKAIFGMEYLKGRPPLYLQNYKFINNKYLGGLPESIKNKFNYRTSFKIKEITRANNPYLTTYKYIIEEKLLNIRINFVKSIDTIQNIYNIKIDHYIRINFDNSTSFYANEEIENLSMCYEFDFEEERYFFKTFRSKYIESLINEFKQKKLIYENHMCELSPIEENLGFIPNFTLIFDGKEITFSKNSFIKCSSLPDSTCSFGSDFFWLFNATEIDYDNNIITFYSDKEIFKHFDNGNNKKKIKYNIFINFTIVFIIFVVLILFFRNKIRKENQENYEKYFNMEKLLKK